MKLLENIMKKLKILCFQKINFIFMQIFQLYKIRVLVIGSFVNEKSFTIMPIVK